MKKFVVAMVLSTLASSAFATVDPVVSEYQKIYALQRMAPSMSEVLIAVNGRTATDCEMISPFDSLVKYEEVIELADYVRMQGGMDGTEKLSALLDQATTAVCQSLISSMVESPKDSTEFEESLKAMTSKHAQAMADGVDSKVASKQLNADFTEIRNELLNKE
ncbi:hypothetical protein A1QO_02770 [Vibrio genomosp. F10 str. ZF-129]|uniref:Uncharacterized protein n=1 Tax=Vibrio genomosp. F10 str. ZF-129 TaxID=1187848 RepID=A0A1E5BKC3_9VIBR|nr:hypothetical protein [Vibrio genomosp. F10]OEE38319.1 hypothetical protein A1QO_02770 [Vibrio genomosp. F10 str. ZF-129]